MSFVTQYKSTFQNYWYYQNAFTYKKYRDRISGDPNLRPAGERRSMSDESISCAKTCEVFVPLLNEGTNVVRPTRAVACGSAHFKLLQPDSYDPDDEQWEFPPGSEVECLPEIHSGREILVARRRVD